MDFINNKNNVQIKLAIIIIGLTFLLYSCSLKQEIKLVTGRIEYEMKIKSPDVEMDWWVQNIEGPEREKFINGIFERIRGGSLKVYDDEMLPLSTEEFERSLEYFDALNIVFLDDEKNIRMDSLVKTRLKNSDFDRLFFREKWFIGSDPFVFEKQVTAFGLNAGKKENLALTADDLKPVFWILPDTVKAPLKNATITVTEKIQYDVFIKSPEPDVEWWQNNIVKSSRIDFTRLLLEKAKSGKLAVHDSYDNTLLTIKDVGNILERFDTITLQKLNPPYDYFDTTFVSRVEPQDIIKIRFLELWSIDWELMKFSKQIIAIAPVVESYSESGGFRGYKPLFWIYLADKKI